MFMHILRFELRELSLPSETETKRWIFIYVSLRG